MAGLYGSLSMAARALDAQRFGLDVTGQNIANVNTPGYARRQAQLSAVPPSDRFSGGNGVKINGLRAQRDAPLERRLQQERPAEAREQAIADSLSIVETALGKPGESIDAQLSSFFDAMSALASDPTSAIARQSAATQGDTLAASFHSMAGRLDQARSEADTGVRDSVDQINALASRIAKLNTQIGGAIGSEEIKDDLGEALQELSGLIDIGTIVRPDGGMDVSFGNGHPLVIGENSYAIEAVSTAPDGMAALKSGDMIVTSEVTGGKVGGLLQARDSMIPDYLGQLDTLAFGVASQVNTVHQAGYDLNGGTGHAFFAPLASAAGAAHNIAMSAAIMADPSTIATGATATAGDNTTARALANLRDAKVLASGTATFASAWGNLVYKVGSDGKAAQDEQSSRAEIVQQVESMREQVSGVSLDEEAMTMMKFQRAYEANARFFQAIDSALDTLLTIVQ